MRWFLITVIFVSICTNIFCQQHEIDFFINKVEHIYPGFSEKINTSKKLNEYKTFKANLLKNEETDTLKILSQLALYFKDRHLMVYEFGLSSKIDTSNSSSLTHQAISYLNNPNKKKHTIEGYWLNKKDSGYLISISKKASSKSKYVGRIIKSRTNKELKALCYFEFEFQQNDNSYLTNCFDYENNFRVFYRSTLNDSQTLIIDNNKIWKKVLLKDTSLINENTPFDNSVAFKLITPENFLIRIPANSQTNTKIVDSLIKVHQTIIEKTPNLIFDIRDNAGGTTRTYSPILPFIYTNPITRISGYRFCSDDFIDDQKYLLEEANKSNDTSRAKRLQKYIDTLLKYRNSYCYEKADTIKFNQIKKYPKNIALIVNYGCMSAAEMMVLDFKQSSKVKIFGDRTFGAVDYLDVFLLFNPPLYKYGYYMPAYKRELRKGQKKLDYVGIIPDIKIPETNKNWVNFVIKFYEENK
jgi:hypothetical protein